MSEEREAYGKIFYGLEGQEILDHGVEEVLERHFDCLSPDQMPETERVLLWRHRTIRIEQQADAILENLLERLDEEHGDPDLHQGNRATPRMTAAARAFLREVAAEYQLWICDPTGEHETVHPRRWGIGRSIQDFEIPDVRNLKHPNVAAWQMLSGWR